MVIPIRMGVMVFGALLYALSSAQIVVANQSGSAYTDGFVQDVGVSDSWNHGSDNALVQTIALTDSEFKAAGSAHSTALAKSNIKYRILTPKKLEVNALIDASVTGDGGGLRTEAHAKTLLHVGFSLSVPATYRIDVFVIDAAGTGGFTLKPSSGIGVSFAAGVSNHRLTGVLPAGQYDLDLGGEAGGATSGSGFQRRATMSIFATFTAVPEPATVAVLVAGVGALVLRRRINRLVPRG